ncbi:MAG TPA: type IV pilus biogenesis/stability protein PilW [Gammaproteobacteria bacterium]|nr:type IV pilus biogenesis/stability protein PilW [Gammaproteobacteria bacterium]
MKTLSIGMAIAAAWLLAGCVSTGAPQSQAQPKLAAKYNVQLGVAYMQQGRLDLALKKLQRALKQDPDLAEAHTAIALVYEKRGDIGLADQHYRRALDIAPHDPKTLNAYGVFLCRHNKVDQSEQYFLAAAANPDYDTPEAAYTNAGVCLLKIGKQDRAEADFRLALKAQPDYPDALWQLARLSFDEGKHLPARAFLQRFMAHNRQPHAEVLWLAARNERALGDRDQARKFAAELIAKFPRSAEARLARKMTGNGG